MNPTPSTLEEREPQWDEHEMVDLAVEIFRQRERVQSPLTPRFPAAQLLFDHLNNENFQPNWDELVLPSGRTVSSCRRLFNNFQRRSSGPSSGPSITYGPTSFSFPSSAGPSRKRSAPAEAFTPIGRPLAPKQPATFPSDTGRSLTGHQPISPLVDPAPALTEPRKKRGRPTKKEQEERRRLHAERAQAQVQSQVLSPALASPFVPVAQQPPPPAPSEGGPQILEQGPAPTAIMATPRTAPADVENNSSSSSGKKRRGRPPKLSDPSDTDPLQQPSFFAPSQAASSAYESPPHSGSTRARRASVSTRSVGTTAGPVQQEPVTQATPQEDARPQVRQRTWNDTVMGASNPRQP